LAESKGASYRTLGLLVAIAASVLLLDQLAKHWVVNNLTIGETVPFLGDFLRLTFVKNPGAAFSLASGSTWIFSIVAAAVVVVIVLFARRITSLAWATVFGLLLGGVLGNLGDRLFREPGFGVGHVVDFLNLWMFPAIFNIADVAIVSAMGLFILLTVRGVGFDGSRVTPASADGDSVDTDPDSDTVPAKSED
jgi:signal peptidase II